LCVIGSNVYFIHSDFTLTLLGSISAGRTNPVSMVDNGFDILIVDGSPNGWQIRLATNAFSQVNDSGFAGADKVDYIDTFIIYNEPGSIRFRSTLSSTQGTPQIRWCLMLHRSLARVAIQMLSNHWL
jgi:hypothetical protein